MTESLHSRPSGEQGRASILGLAAATAFLAGATDVYGLAELHNLYVSFMSGNTTMLGVALGSGDPARAAKIFGLIGLFVVGAASGAMIANFFGRSQTPAVMWAVSVALCVPLLIPSCTTYAFILEMGALNAATSRVGAASVSLTFVTGALVKFGQGLGNWITGRRADKSWLVQGAMWGSLLSGSGAAASARHLGISRPWPLPLFSVLLTAIAFAMRPVAVAAREHPGQAPSAVPQCGAASGTRLPLSRTSDRRSDGLHDVRS